MIKLIIPLLVFLILLFSCYRIQDKEERKRLFRICLIIGVIGTIVGFTFRTVQIKFWNNVEEETTQQQTINQ